MKISRRDFLISALTAIPALLLEKYDLIAKEKTERYRYLNGIDRKVSVFGIGSTRPLTPEIVEYAIDSGITLVDTAYVYQGGRSEVVIGKVMKKKRDKVFLITKLDPRAWKRKDKKKAFHKSLETSLQRLQTDYVDAIFAHNIKGPEIIAEPAFYEFFHEAKEAGKVKYLGFSFHQKAEEILSEALKHPQLKFILFPFWAIMKSKRAYDLLMENYRRGATLLGMKARMSFMKLNIEGSEKCLFNFNNPRRSRYSREYLVNAARLALGFKEMSSHLVSMTTFEEVDAYVKALGKLYRGRCENLPAHMRFLLS